MKFRILIFGIILLHLAIDVDSQRITIGGFYTSSNAYFLKNLPGLSLSYEHQIQKQFLFLDLNASYKEQSYSYTYSVFHINTYDVRYASGSIFQGKVKLGAARNLIDKDDYRVSIGAFLGLNYLNQQEDITNLVEIDTLHTGIIIHNTIDKWYSNKFGYGFLLDMELRRFLVDNLSLFSRIEFSNTKHDPVARGIYTYVFSYNSISFTLGMKYSFSNKNASP